MIPDLTGTTADFEEAWKFYIWLEATDWKHLPKAGGLEDQEEILMENIFKISGAVNRIRRNKKDARQ